MSLMIKDPGGRIDYAFDWAAAYLDGQVIAASSWAVEPVEAGGVTVDSHAFDTVRTSARLSGGREGVTLGSVTSDGVQFSAELGSRDGWLDGTLVPETSAECRAELGDAQCRVALAGRTRRAVVAGVSGDALTLTGSWAGDSLAFGRLRWLDGAARGLWSVIVAQDGAVLTLGDVPDGVGIAGQRVELIEGCDKRAATCAARFGNIANFRGEPHLPGMDLLTRFPGG